MKNNPSQSLSKRVQLLILILAVMAGSGATLWFIRYNPAPILCQGMVQFVLPPQFQFPHQT